MKAKRQCVTCGRWRPRRITPAEDVRAELLSGFPTDNAVRMSIKTLLARVAVSNVVARRVRSLVRPATPIFMMHRFESPDLGVGGVSPAVLASHLAYLRREGYDLVQLMDLTTPARNRRPRVAFTLDDGMTDFIDIGLNVFKEYDCPCTVFVATGFVDGTCWHWHDQIELMFTATTRKSISVEVAGKTYRFELNSPAAVEHAISRCSLLLRAVASSDRVSALRRLGHLLEVEIPSQPPPRYTAMSWDQIRRCADTGLVTFGPHSVTHPELTALTEEESRREILGSWQRIQEAGTGVIPIFAYPFGTYLMRDVAILSKTTLAGAVTSEFRYAKPNAFAPHNDDQRFTVPRVTYVENMREFRQTVNGHERIKLALQHGWSGWNIEGRTTSYSGGSGGLTRTLYS